MNKRTGIRAGVMAPILPDELIVREDALQWLLTCAGQEQQAEAGLWAAARQNPGLLLAAMGLLAAAFLATAAALWRMSR